MFSITFPHFLIIIGVMMSAFANYHYVSDTIRGTTKPNRVTFFMWALAPMVASIIAVSAGADPWSNTRVFVGGFFPFVVFLASFYNPHSYWKLDMYDIGCGVLSFLALIIWLVVRQSDLAILLLLAGDAFASIPTIRKAWKAPETETGISYLLYAAVTFLAFFSIPIWNVGNAAFLIYFLFVNVLIAFLIYRPKLTK